jgi:hypothetical protein
MLGLVVLLVLAPMAAVMRWWRRWRRGGAVRTSIVSTRIPAPGRGELVRLQLDLDVPAVRVAGVRRWLTETMVRVAEALRHQDDVYHQLAWDPEEGVLHLAPVGPQLQELGDRFLLTLGRRAAEGLCQVWLTLPRSIGLGQAMAGLGFDPEAEGEPDHLLGVLEVCWAAASEVVSRDPVQLIRLVLFVPPGAEAAVRGLLERAVSSLEASPLV